MFGHNRRKRERKKLRKEKEEFSREKTLFENRKPEIERQNDEALKSQANTLAQQYKNERQQAYGEGRKRAEELFSRNIEGLTPQQRTSMQESGQHRLGREYQGYQQQLAAAQGRRGVRGGAAYAQQADLARAAGEAQQQSQRDLSQLDSDLMLKKLAAMFNIEQGEAQQGSLDRQVAQDQLELQGERRRQRNIEDQFNRLFSRV
jgi:hypothetical protein